MTCAQPLYVRARHPTNLLLRDATGLRTQWATGIKATKFEMKSLEQQESTDAIVQFAKNITSKQVIDVTPPVECATPEPVREAVPPPIKHLSMLDPQYAHPTPLGSVTEAVLVETPTNRLEHDPLATHKEVIHAD